jgi:hypothetical protein
LQVVCVVEFIGLLDQIRRVDILMGGSQVGRTGLCFVWLAAVTSFPVGACLSSATHGSSAGAALHAQGPFWCGLRTRSPTFGQWLSVELTAATCCSCRGGLRHRKRFLTLADYTDVAPRYQ